ncbi:hypothetical protein HOLleu_00116 [Holothuria leucospilota]|uniref:Uncharacterized protein n=1 Tax=Holothuria leucospilota TaxID=206669 RepID=A0A9Q1CM97_HOLLE|nr:hypothetical protein HOLleu_00116 [Holothuria leucospilota]
MRFCTLRFLAPYFECGLDFQLQKKNQSLCQIYREHNTGFKVKQNYSTDSSRLADVDGRYDNLLSATILDHQQFYSKFLIVEDRKINSSNPNLQSVY